MSDTDNPLLDGKDPYEILEVHPRARSVVIAAAHRTLTAILPKKDLPLIDGAFEVLSSDTKREEYDKRTRAKVGKTIGPYKLIDLIAEGGFGRTYKAEHTILKEPVCIKDCSNVPAQFSWMLVDEAKALWDLRHYALPAIRDLIRLEDGRIALVMSYIPGLTLRQVIEKVGKLDTETVAWITDRILNALRYSHHNGVIHGDVKPGNVILQPEKHMAVLVDFGLSAVLPTGDSKSKGHTPNYAPPEEINREPLVPESDLYSLGMTMIFALSGSDEAVKSRHVPKEVPEELCDFIRTLIAREVSDRTNWEKEDIIKKLSDIRKKLFGSRRSGMKPIAGL